MRQLGKGIATVDLVVGSGIDGRGGAAPHFSQIRCIVRGQADIDSLGVPWIRGLTIEKSRSAPGFRLLFVWIFFLLFFGFPSLGLENASSAPDKARSDSAPTRRALQARENGQSRRDG